MILWELGVWKSRGLHLISRVDERSGSEERVGRAPLDAFRSLSESVLRNWRYWLDLERTRPACGEKRKNRWCHHDATRVGVYWLALVHFPPFYVFFFFSGSLSFSSQPRSNKQSGVFDRWICSLEVVQTQTQHRTHGTRHGGLLNGSVYLMESSPGPINSNWNKLISHCARIQNRGSVRLPFRSSGLCGFNALTTS